MAYQKVDSLAELKLMARGKKTTVPAYLIADWAVGWVKAGLRRAGPTGAPVPTKRTYATRHFAVASCAGRLIIVA